MNALPAPLIIDSHTHLDDAAFEDDLDEVMEASRQAGVRHFINIAYSPESWESSRALQSGYPDISVAVGLHPQQASQFDLSLWRNLSHTVRDAHAVAIGETGFDFSRTGPSFEEQEQAFRRQLELASEERLPTIIHQRNAEDALMNELDRWPNLAPIVLHSFEGTDRLVDWALERGCYIGIGGLATRRGSDELRGLLARLPVNRLLLETDSPYLSPAGAISRRNTPVNLPLTANILAPLWNLSALELCHLTSVNAIAVFQLPLINLLSEVDTNGPQPEPHVARRDLKCREDSRNSRSSAS